MTGATKSPPDPGTTDSGIAHVYRMIFSSESLLVKIGVVILFFGISFLVKYAAERDLLPIELRLSAAALTGIALLIIGWRLRDRRAVYAQALQGGGIGILYVTTFASLRLYGLIPAAAAFPLLVAIATFSAILAVLQNSQSLALLGVSGGFLAPLLASTGSGSHIVLFGYYSLLNLSIAGVAWFRSWRTLNLVGFFFTFVIGLLWGLRFYRPEHFSSTEPFLILFFLLYTAVAVLFALRQEPNLRGLVDGTLVFATPIISFSLQAALVKPYAYGLAWSALALGTFYLALAWFLFRKQPRFMGMLTEAFLALGVVFTTLAIPLALENRWTSAAWALEGTALIWIGLRQNRFLSRWAGLLLHVGAGLYFLSPGDQATSTLPILNGHFLGIILLAMGSALAAYLYDLFRKVIPVWEHVVGTLLLAGGLLWWLFGGIGETIDFIPETYRMAGILTFLGVTALTCAMLRKRLPWNALFWPAAALLPALYLCAFVLFVESGHPGSQGCLFLWPLVLGSYYTILYWSEPDYPALLPSLHGATLWLATGLASYELAWRVDRFINGSSVWPIAASALIPALVLLVMATCSKRIHWPLAVHQTTYRTLGAGPIILFLVAWIWAANGISSGNPAPLPYLPLINPLDLMVLFSILTLGMTVRDLVVLYPNLRSDTSYSKPLAALASFTLFLWLNGILIRTVHHWGKIPFAVIPLFNSVLLQTTLSLFWSILALCAMIFATRNSQRPVWLGGAALLALVVGKLFLVDLSGTGTVARIISFVGVGILLLVIGYITPAPPKDSTEKRQ